MVGHSASLNAGIRCTSSRPASAAKEESCEEFEIYKKDCSEVNSFPWHIGLTSQEWYWNLQIILR